MAEVERVELPRLFPTRLFSRQFSSPIDLHFPLGSDYGLEPQLQGFGDLTTSHCLNRKLYLAVTFSSKNFFDEVCYCVLLILILAASGVATIGASCAQVLKNLPS